MTGAGDKEDSSHRRTNEWVVAAEQIPVHGGDASNQPGFIPRFVWLSPECGRGPLGTECEAHTLRHTKRFPINSVPNS